MIKLPLSTSKEGLYEAYDSGAVEVEVAEFLYGFTRIIKPQRVLTTGIYTGVSDAYIAQGLKENGFGKITALEIEPQHLNRAKELWQKIEVSEYIDPILASSLEFQPTGLYQLMMLDSEPGIRWKELERFYSRLEPGGYVFLHDLPRGFCKGNINPDHPEFQDWPWGPVPETIKTLLKNQDLLPFHLPNPREMCGFYKKSSGDYTL